MANEKISKLKKIRAEAVAILSEKGVGAAEHGQAPYWRRFLHFWVMVVKSFVRNRCPVRASALTYSSLLALIPMLAVVLSVTTSILKKQGEEPIRKFVNQLVTSVTPYTNPEGATGNEKAAQEAAAAREEAVKKINEFISRTQSGAIGLTGTIALLFVAISMLSRIEDTFNDIWGVMRGRSWYMKIVLYWAAITLGPVMLISALGLASGPHLATTKKLLMMMPLVGGFLFDLLPLLVLCVAFGMFYLLIPNTRVQFSAAMVGGFVAALAWHTNNKLSVIFVSRITSNNAIYGSLGMVPVFMIGLYLGWLILLFGAQVAYGFQNRKAYAQERLAESISQRGREFVALRIMTRLAQDFHRGEKAPTLTQLATSLGVPSRLAGHILQTLIQCHLVVEVLNRVPGYAPARPLANITAHDVLMSLRAGHGTELTTADDATRPRVRDEFERFYEAEKEVAASVTLQELVAETAGSGSGLQATSSTAL